MMSKNSFNLRALSRAIGLATLATSIAHTTTILAEDGDSGRSIEEVIVSAERRESSVQDTSISITALTAGMMEDFGVRNQSDLQNLVPATTIQPYDSAIRGVGRNFRNLGGDPGVATYMNGVYSEDLYTATIGSFWDIERIEVLRGPQGTLYGRNAVGGAINFLYNKPTDEFEGSLKTVQGNFDTKDYYGMVSGPLIDGVLNGRFAFSMRKHDGYIEEKSGLGPDLDSGDEKNGSISLEWLINEDMTVNLRSNRAKVDRVMGGADGGGLIVLNGENFLPGEIGQTFGSHNNDVLGHGIRRVDPNTSIEDRLSSTYQEDNLQTFTFTNPATGEAILAQRARPGVDSQDAQVNYSRDSTANDSDCIFLDRKDIDGDDLCAYTNGQNNETFNQQGNQLEYSWDISEALTFKYIFGYNELLYERITDDDATGSIADDRQFYVNHEAEYTSHELQLFWDVGDDLTFTSGVFFYDANIDQRGDYFTTSDSAQFTDPTFAFDNYLATALGGALSGEVAPGDPPLTFLTPGGADPINIDSAKEFAEANGIAQGEFVQVAGAWLGDASLGRVDKGPSTFGTDLQYDTRTERKAFAAYTQGVWDIDERFTLTAGIRYASDETYGEENLARYAETEDFFGAIPGLSLASLNIARGAIDPDTLEVIEGGPDPYLQGVPITFGAHRNLKRKDTKVTWRVNLDYNLSDDELIYANVTTGYRAGGFNLVFFSQSPEYDPEELIAYELGFKGQYLDNSLQVNGSAYFYDYDSIHTFVEEACPTDSTLGAQSSCAVVDTTASVVAAPGAEMYGFEMEVLWLATDQLTIGGNYSYTHSEYSEDFNIVDGSSPDIPFDLYTLENGADRVVNVKGNQLLQVPEQKTSIYAMYALGFGDMGDVDLLASWSWIDEVYFSAFEAELDRAPAYDRLDLRATWTSVDQNWVVSGFVNNIMDEIGIRQILRNGAPNGYNRTAQVTEPRSYGLEVSFSF